MKIISSTVLVALFAASNARFLDASNSALTVAQTYGSTAFATTLNCGQCIGLGYNYCIQKAENTLLNADAATSVQTCQNPTTTSVSQYGDNTYSCSNAFADRVYSKYTCQFNTASCGVTNNTLVLSAVNATTTVAISSLSSGNTCFYKVLTQCGAPAFRPVNNTSNFEYEYVYVRDTDVVAAADPVVTGAGAQTNATRRAAAPASGMPRRNQYFNLQTGGNSIANVQQSTYNASTNGTMYGYSGRFDKVAGGRKVWGTQDQSASMGQFYTNSTVDCANRWQFVAVTNVASTAQSTNITFSSVDFYHAPSTDTSGASFLSMTFAAVLGLISLAFF